MTTHSRKKKLIKPQLQLRLIGRFGGVAALALLMQFLLLGNFLMKAAAGIEGAGGQLADQVPRVLVGVFALSLVVLMPIFLGVGVMLTFRYAGPIYRFEQYLNGIVSGEDEGIPCKIREGDELQFLCDSINRAVEHLRNEEAVTREDDQEASVEEPEAAQAA